MCSWRKDHPFDLVITTGDNIYPDGRPALFESKFFDPMSCLLDRGVRFHAVLGNHDIIRLQGRAEVHHPNFGMDGRNYVVRESGVRFVMADSNRPMDFTWLRQATRAQEGDRWTIVVFHHPVHSPAAQHGPSPWLQDLPELFARRGVDLVLNGHDHLYAVTEPLDRIRYVVTGGGGAGLYDCLPSAVTEVCIERHHFLYVVAGEDRISVRAVPTSGVAFDRFSTTGRGPS
jgi:predicted phosphodiesterase